MKTTTNLRQLLHTGPMVVAPFILNAMHAKIAEAVGFPAVYMTGAGTAAERGFPDVGLLTMSEMVANARYIADAVQIPVICDADTGYGNPLNVQRTVREYERAGVVAIQPGHTLVTSGVYGVIRHPSYLGLLVNALGWGLAFRSGIGMLLTALMIPPLLARIHAEERLLRTQFGAAYGAHCARTSRLIPGLY